jgi:hypothetical protein
MSDISIYPNSFITRQTEESPYSYSTQSWEELAQECEINFDAAKPGYTDGVLLVPISTETVFSGVCLLGTNQPLSGKFESRRDGEAPRKTLHAVGGVKAPAQSAFVVLYCSAILSADGSNQLPPDEGNWEMISLNASPVEGEMPINPMVLMHNHFGSDGGTDTGLSSEQFEELLREAFLFWRDKAMCG